MQRSLVAENLANHFDLEFAHGEVSHGVNDNVANANFPTELVEWNEEIFPFVAFHDAANALNPEAISLVALPASINFLRLGNSLGSVIETIHPILGGIPFLGLSQRVSGSDGSSRVHFAGLFVLEPVVEIVHEIYEGSYIIKVNSLPRIENNFLVAITAIDPLIPIGATANIAAIVFLHVVRNVFQTSTTMLAGTTLCNTLGGLDADDFHDVKVTWFR